MAPNPRRINGGPARPPKLHRQNATLGDLRGPVGDPADPAYRPLPGAQVAQEPQTRLLAPSGPLAIEAGLAPTAGVLACLKPQVTRPTQQQGDAGTPDGSPISVGQARHEEDPAIQRSGDDPSVTITTSRYQTVEKTGTANTSSAFHPANKNSTFPAATPFPSRTNTGSSLKPPALSAVNVRARLPPTGDKPPLGDKR